MPDMRSVSFHADGLRLDADLYLPGEVAAGERRPGLIALSGYTGLKVGIPRVWAPSLAERGYVCLGMDYRGYGRSEGPRGRALPQEQVEDVRAAVSFLEQAPEVDPDRIGLFGWAQGAGVAIVEAADDLRVRAVATIHAVGDMGRVTRLLHTDASWDALLARLAEDRRSRASTGSSELVDPFEIFPLEPKTRLLVFERLYQMPNYGTPVSLESAEAMLRFRPELVVDRISPRPLLLLHGGENMLHRPEESERLFAHAGEPKELAVYKGKGHLDWGPEDGEAEFEAVVDRLAGFFAAAFALSP